MAIYDMFFQTILNRVSCIYLLEPSFKHILINLIKYLPISI